MVHVISWSGGKDSTATVILFHRHEAKLLAPGDKVIVLFVEVMFDLINNISGHNPDIIDFIYKTKLEFESWGYEVRILRADKDYLDFFHHKMGRSRLHPEHEGMTYGFPASGICGIKRDLKLKPLEQFKKAIASEEHLDYVGIAVDEPKRLEALYKEPDTVSLLDRCGYTEAMAKELCKEYGMLSPQYALNNGKQKRDGCWFCPNAKLCEHEAIYKAHPEAWAKYVALEDEPNLAYPKWNCFAKDTLHERDCKIKGVEYTPTLQITPVAVKKANGYHQLTLDEYLDSLKIPG